jgi:hypothetical protein
MARFEPRLIDQEHGAVGLESLHAMFTATAEHGAPRWYG